MGNNPFYNFENLGSGQNSSSEWTEESSPTQSSGSGRADFLSLSLTKNKIFVFLLLIFLGLGLLLSKSFYLQVVMGNDYFSMAESNRLRTKYVKAHRGIIYDRNGEVLVQNVFGFSLLVTPAQLPRDQAEKEKILNIISDLAEIDVGEIEEKIKEASQYYFQPIAIKTGIGYERAMALKIMSADLPGVGLEIDSWRHYLVGEEFSHLLGYVGKINAEEYQAQKNDYLLSDNIGKAGLEQYYEDYLRGEHGKKRMEVDAFGREKKIISEIKFIAGADLVLSVDAKLQKKTYEVLKDKLKDNKAATVIISNPQNGEILAMVDYPSYNNNLFAVGIGYEDYASLLDNEFKPLFTRSILGEYPAGSTIKPVMAISALQEDVITPYTSLSSVGGIWVADLWFFPDWKGGGHGATNLFKAIAESVNTYFYYIGGGYGDFEGLGVERISEYLKKFGLGKKLGIDLPGEKAGLIPNKEWKEEVKNESWYIGDTYHLSIGQGDLLVTPLQVNNYNATVANGGTIYKPHLVRGMIYPDSKKEVIMPVVIDKDFVDVENVNSARRGMKEAVEYGSAKGLFGLSVTSAGKTGTAQWHPTKDNHAWFNAFAPYNNPDFAITVLVEEGGEGSVIAVPIAREIMSWWFDQVDK